MSDTVIADGTGTCNRAEVDDKFRLSAKATANTVFESAIANERAFSIISGDITLTSDDESAILYVCNNEVSDLIIDQTVIGVGVGADSSGLPQSISYVNPYFSRMANASLEFRLGPPNILFNKTKARFSDLSNDQ